MTICSSKRYLEYFQVFSGPCTCIGTAEILCGGFWIKARGRWGARIDHEGRQHNLGSSFADERVAAEAYDSKARELRGERAMLNFS